MRVIAVFLCVVVLPLDAVAAAGFTLTMEATGFENVQVVQQDDVVQSRDVTVEAGLLDGYEGDASLPISINPQIETIHALHTGGSGCGWAELECYSEVGLAGSTIPCDSGPGTVKSYRLRAHARCTLGCCNGYFEATAFVSLERRTSRLGTPVAWTSEPVSAPFLLRRSDVPRSPVGQETASDAPPPLAHIVDFVGLGGVVGSGIPPTVVRQEIDSGNEVGNRVTTTTRYVSSADYVAESDTHLVLVGAFAEPTATGPLGFPANGPHAWATLAELGLSLPPVVSFAVGPERSIAPENVKVFQHGQAICFSGHPFSFHLPPEDLVLEWRSSAFPRVEIDAINNPTHFCSSDLSQGQGAVELTVSELDPTSGAVVAESTARQLLRVVGVPTLLVHDTWGDPRSLEKLAADLSSQTGSGDAPPVPTYAVDLSAPQAENVIIPIDFPLPPVGRGGEREALFELTPSGRIVKGAKVKAPLDSIFRIDVPFDADLDFGANWLGYLLAGVAEFFISYVLPSSIVVAETGVPSGSFKSDSGQPAADLVLDLSLRNFDVEYFPATPADADEPPNSVDDYGRGPRLKFEIVLALRFDLQPGAIIEGYHEDEIPLIPNSLLSGITDAGELVQLAIKFGLTMVHEDGDVKGLQGGASIVYRTTVPMALAKAQGPVAGYVPTLAARVQEAKNSTGLDRVNVVGHGMGGLVARYYSQFVGQDVSKLVLVAAPNHGADFYFAVPFYSKMAAKAVSVYLAGPTVGGWIASFIGTVIDAIFGQAARDMSPHSDVIAMLNGHRGDTAQPQEQSPPTADFVYTLSGFGVGGQLTPTHFHIPNPIATEDPLYPLPNAPDFVVPGIVSLCLIPGADCNPYGDVVVPEDSVVIQNGAAIVNNDRIDARHWSIKEVLSGTATVASRLADDPPQGSSSPRIFPGQSAQVLRSEEYLLEPGAEAGAGFDVDAGALGLIAEVLAGGDMPQVTLTDPTGGTTVLPIQQPDSGLSVGSLTVGQPLAGRWQLRASLPADAASSAGVTLRAVATSPTLVGLATGKTRYAPGEDVVISMVTMSDAQMATADEAGATVVMPSGEHRYVRCFDDGEHGDGEANDGYCVGVLSNVVEQGSYRVIGWARQRFLDAGLPTFVDRRAYATFEVRRDVNLTVDALETSTSTPVDGDLMTLTADVTNHGLVVQTGIPVVFSAGGRRFDVQIVDLDPGATAAVSTQWEAQHGVDDLIASVCPSTGLMESRLVPASSPREEPVLEPAFDDNAASTTVIVQPGEPPVARPRSVASQPGVHFLLDGSASTSGVPINSYEWELGAPSAPIAAFEGRHVSVDLAALFPGDGSPGGPVPIRLTITDAVGRADTGTATLKVEQFDNNVLAGDIEAPLPDAGPDSVVFARDPLVLDGSASSDNFGIAWAFWDLDIVRAQPVADVVGLVAALRDGFNTPGGHTARLYVNDVRGNGPAWDDVNITVLKRPVTLSIHAPGQAESGRYQRFTVAVRDQAGRWIVDQGYVELSLTQRPSRTWVQHVSDCGVAVFNLRVDLPPRAYDIDVRFSGSLIFEDAALHQPEALEVVDSQGPNVSVGNLDQGVLTDGEDWGVEVEITDDGSLVEEPSILLDGEPVQNGDAIPAEELTPGQHVLEVVAADSHGNVTTQQNDVVVRPQVPPNLSGVFGGGLCASGNTTVSDHAAISGQGAQDGIIVAGDLHIRRHGLLAGSAVVGCDATIADRGRITGDLAASGAISVACRADVEGEVVELPCDLCASPTLPSRCEWLDLSHLRRLAEARLALTRDELRPSLPRGALCGSDSLTLRRGVSASIPAGVYSVRSLHLKDRSKLNVTSGRAVILILDDLEVEDRVTIGRCGDGELALVLLSASPVRFGRGTFARTALYAPRADLSLCGGNTLLEGSTIVRDLRVSGNSQLIVPASHGVWDPESWCQ